MDDSNVPRRRMRGFMFTVLRKAVTLVIVGLVFGWLYDRAMPWAYPPERPVGFNYGVLHGAMMPIALPTLLMGKDVTIFANNNSGRGYKIGYICGINLCGLIFFGLAFYRPARAVPPTSANFDKPQ
jgi:hypothetical protein